MTTVVSFHAYKGGAGRSFVVANVAWALASAGRSVLVLDFDLQTPALHDYFAPFLVDAGMQSSEGLLDAAVEVLDGSSRAFDLDRYAVSLEWEFPQGGTLDFVPAGRQTESYAAKASTIDWRPIETGRIGAVLQSVRKTFAAYDVVLIDSAAGFNELSRFCVGMADRLVLCLPPNVRELKATRSLLDLLLTNRADRRSLPVFPVPTMSDLAEKDRLDRWRHTCRSLFDGHPVNLAPQDRTHYWNDVELPYVAFYAYGPLLAAFAEEPRTASSPLMSTANLASFLTDSKVLPVTPDPSMKHTMLQKYWL